MEISPFVVVQEVFKIIEDYPKKYRSKRNLVPGKLTDVVQNEVKPSETSISPNQPSSSSRSLKKRKVSAIGDDKDHENTVKVAEKVNNNNDDDDDDENYGKKKVINGPNPPPDMPQELKEFIANEFEGYDLQLILQRKAYKSDVNTQQNRFSIPEGKLESRDFLTPKEWAEAAERFEADPNNNKITFLKNGEEKEPPMKGRKVLMVDIHRKVHVLDFKKWKLKSTNSYMFTLNWSHLVKSIGLKVDHIVQIWFFRDKECEPCFAILKL